MHVLEMLYNFQLNRNNIPNGIDPITQVQKRWLTPEEYKWWIKWCFDNASSNTINANDIYQIYMTWERYHHNQIWCMFAVETDIEQQMLDNNSIQEIQPLFRLDASSMLKMLQWKEKGIACELFAKKITRKYIHIKARTRLMDD